MTPESRGPDSQLTAYADTSLVEPNVTSIATHCLMGPVHVQLTCATGKSRCLAVRARVSLDVTAHKEHHEPGGSCACRPKINNPFCISHSPQYTWVHAQTKGRIPRKSICDCHWDGGCYVMRWHSKIGGSPCSSSQKTASHQCQYEEERSCWARWVTGRHGCK